MEKKVDIIKDADGKSIVVINDLRFKGRRSVDWKRHKGIAGRNMYAKANPVSAIKEMIGNCHKQDICGKLCAET